MDEGEDSCFYLVVYIEHNVIDVCERKHFKKKSIDGKRILHAQYANGLYYPCKILFESSDYDWLNAEAFAYKKRLKIMKTRYISPATVKKSSNIHCLVKFFTTEDLFICQKKDLVNEDISENGYHRLICFDRIKRNVLLIDTGVKQKMIQRYRDFEKYAALSSPLRRETRNPLIPYTPRIQLVPPLQCRSSYRANNNVRRRIFENLESSDDEQLTTELEEPFQPSDPDDDPPYVPESESSNEDDGVLQDTSNARSSKALNVPEYKLGDEDHEDDDLVIPGTPQRTISVLQDISTNVSTDSNITTEQFLTIAQDVQTNVLAASCHSNVELKHSPPGHPRKKRTTRNVHACIFCKKVVTQMPRHLRMVHKEHPQVTTILSNPDKQAQVRLLQELRDKGTFEHNVKVLNQKNGYFIVQRRGVAPKTHDYLPCPNCKRFFKATSLHKHVKSCDPEYTRYNRIQSKSAALLTTTIQDFDIKGPGFKILKTKVFPIMTRDDITKVAVSDKLIVKWAAFYCSMRLMKKRKEYMSKVASQKMRLLGRLLIVIRQLFGNQSTLEQFVCPQRFDDLVEAVRKLGGEEKEGNFGVPSIPIAIGYLLLACANILRGEASRVLDHLRIASAKEFIKLYQKEWPKLLTVRAHDQLKEERFSKRSVKLLPLAGDIMVYYKYLQSEESKLTQQLRDEEFSLPAWIALNKVLLSSLLLFNRKRVGDVQHITLDCYYNKCGLNDNSDIYNTLNNAEKLIGKGYVHFYTRGKKDSMVPVMIPIGHLPSYDLMINLRGSAGVDPQNEYLFGRADTYIDGSEAIRITSKNSGARNHHLLRSTALRKHIATMSQVLNMKDSDLDTLADYLGHNRDVHRKFYRLPEESLHLTQMSRLLAAVSTNEIDKIRGKALDELPMPTAETTIDFILPTDDAPNTSTANRSTANTSAATSNNFHNISTDAIHMGCKAITNAKRWTLAEKKAVFEHLSDCIQEKRLPSKDEVENCLVAEPTLIKRTWRNVKDFIRNQLVSQERKEKNSKT